MNLRRQRWRSRTSGQEATKRATGHGTAPDVCPTPQIGPLEDGKTGAVGPPLEVRDLEKTPTEHAGIDSTNAVNMTRKSSTSTKGANAKALSGQRRQQGGTRWNGEETPWGGEKDDLLSRHLPDQPHKRLHNEFTQRFGNHGNKDAQCKRGHHDHDHRQ